MSQEIPDLQDTHTNSSEKTSKEPQKNNSFSLEKWKQLILFLFGTISGLIGVVFLILSLNDFSFINIYVAIIFLMLGVFCLFLIRRISVSKLLDLSLPDTSENRAKITPHAAASNQNNMLEDEFESLKSKTRFELKKTRIAVEYSSLSISGKNQCKSLLDEAESSINQAKKVTELQYSGELIKLASQLTNAVKNDSRLVLLYTVIILVLLILLGYFTFGLWDQMAFTNNIFGVPLGVLLWSGIGGFVSVPYRYVFQQEEFQEPAIKWLFIRPIIGVILGTVAYFAFSISLFILDSDNLDLTKLMNNRSVVLLVLAFFAGFSDRFAIFILRSVIGRIAPAWAEKASQEES